MGVVASSSLCLLIKYYTVVVEKFQAAAVDEKSQAAAVEMARAEIVDAQGVYAFAEERDYFWGDIMCDDGVISSYFIPTYSERVKRERIRQLGIYVYYI